MINSLLKNEISCLKLKKIITEKQIRDAIHKHFPIGSNAMVEETNRVSIGKVVGYSRDVFITIETRLKHRVTSHYKNVSKYEGLC